MPHKFKYDWIEIQKFYNLGNSLKECRDKFGFGITAMTKAIKKNRLVTRTIGQSIALACKKGKLPQLTTEGWDDKGRETMRQHALRRGLGGQRNHHKIIYKGVILDSTYEHRVAIVLDRDGIEWVRPKNTFHWVDNDGKAHRYKPDFYLPKENIYLDPKNKYLAKFDQDKINRVVESNDIKVLIIPLDTIKQWEQSTFSILL